MTNKTKISYTDIFNYIATDLAPHFTIQIFVTDFELGLSGALKSIYPNAQECGCNFHFVKVDISLLCIYIQYTIINSIYIITGNN